MRIISLFPAATEMVCALGAADSLVGISHDSDFPAELLRDVPRVTRSTIDGNAAPAEIDRMVRVADTLGESLHALDAGAIADLEPDVIVTQGICDVCAIRESDVRIIAESLRRTPIVLSLSANSLDEMLDDIRRVGAVIERSPMAESLVLRLEARLGKVHERLVAAAVPRPRVAVIEWTDPIYNAGHWVPQMVRRAGGIEVLAKAGERSRVVTMEELRRRAGLG
jgi:iron complex transport system substrate-binding protein